MTRTTWLALIALLVAIAALILAKWPGLFSDPEAHKEPKTIGDRLTGILASPRETVERALGPPVAIKGVRRDYRIDGCDVRIKYDTVDFAAAWTLKVSPDCSFAWADVVPALGDLPPMHDMSFADAMKREHAFWLDCIVGCTDSKKFEGAKLEILGTKVTLHAEPEGSNAEILLNLSAAAREAGAEPNAAQCGAPWADAGVVGQLDVTGVTIGDAGVCPKVQTASTPPNGAYQKTCEEIEVREDFLVAKCRDFHGALRYLSKISLPCEGEVVNHRGELRCQKGTFLHDGCVGVYEDWTQENGRWLNGTCPAPGRWKITATRLPCIADTRVKNVQGKLQCAY